MNRSVRQGAWMGCVLAASLMLSPPPGAAGHESFGVYEDWRGRSTIRSDRWTVVEAGQAHEASVRVKDGRLVMRQRREGPTTSDAGSVAAVQTLLEEVNGAPAKHVELIFQPELVVLVDSARLLDALLDQKSRVFNRVTFNRRARFCSIGNARRVSQVDHALMRQAPANRTKHGQTTDA